MQLIFKIGFSDRTLDW